MSNRLESNDGWKRAKMSKLQAAVIDRRYSAAEVSTLNTYFREALLV